MHNASIDTTVRVHIDQARQARSHAFNDGLSAIFGRKPRPDRRR